MVQSPVKDEGGDQSKVLEFVDRVAEAQKVSETALRRAGGCGASGGDEKELTVQVVGN